MCNDVRDKLLNAIMVIQSVKKKKSSLSTLLSVRDIKRHTNFIFSI